jgi:hypothetical protein
MGSEFSTVSCGTSVAVRVPGTVMLHLWMEKPTDELRADESPHVAPAWNRNRLVRKNRKRKGKCQRTVSGARTRE